MFTIQPTTNYFARIAAIQDASFLFNFNSHMHNMLFEWAQLFYLTKHCGSHQVHSVFFLHKFGSFYEDISTFFIWLPLPVSLRCY